MNCPKCGLNEENLDERIDPVTEFLLGYGCYGCGYTWSATSEQREAHNERLRNIILKARENEYRRKHGWELLK
jgi:hypothetical protein